MENRSNNGGSSPKKIKFSKFKQRILDLGYEALLKGKDRNSNILPTSSTGEKGPPNPGSMDKASQSPRGSKRSFITTQDELSSCFLQSKKPRSSPNTQGNATISMEVLNSGGHLSLSHLPTEPPSYQTNGNHQNVYQAPQQHNGQLLDDTCVAQPEQKLLYKEYQQQSSRSDQYDVRSPKDQMNESQGQQIHNVHSFQVLSPLSQPAPHPQQLPVTTCLPIHHLTSLASHAFPTVLTAPQQPTYQDPQQPPQPPYTASQTPQSSDSQSPKQCPNPVYSIASQSRSPRPQAPPVSPSPPTALPAPPTAPSPGGPPLPPSGPRSSPKSKSSGNCPLSGMTAILQSAKLRKRTGPTNKTPGPGGTNEGSSSGSARAANCETMERAAGGGGMADVDKGSKEPEDSRDKTASPSKIWEIEGVNRIHVDDYLSVSGSTTESAFEGSGCDSPECSPVRKAKCAPVKGLAVLPFQKRFSSIVLSSGRKVKFTPNISRTGRCAPDRGTSAPNSTKELSSTSSLKQDLHHPHFTIEDCNDVTTADSDKILKICGSKLSEDGSLARPSQVSECIQERKEENLAARANGSKSSSSGFDRPPLHPWNSLEMCLNMEKRSNPNNDADFKSTASDGELNSFNAVFKGWENEERLFEDLNPCEEAAAKKSLSSSQSQLSKVIVPLSSNFDIEKNSTNSSSEERLQHDIFFVRNQESEDDKNLENEEVVEEMDIDVVEEVDIDAIQIEDEENEVHVDSQQEPELNDLVQLDSNGKKLTKKKISNPIKWKRNAAKLKRNSGEEYVNRAGKVKAPRPVTACANCQYKCKDKISPVEQNDLRAAYNDLPHDNAKKIYLSKLVQEYENKKTVSKEANDANADEDDDTEDLDEVGKKKKRLVYHYHLPVGNETVRVCRNFFCGTFGIHGHTVSYMFQKCMNKTTLSYNGRKRHVDLEKQAKIKSQRSQCIRHILQLPKVESHYRRAESKREYLETRCKSIAQCYLKFQDWMVEQGFECKDIPSEYIYKQVFNTEFNLSFHKPKNDTCQTCFLYDTRKSHGDLTEEETAVFEKHITDKNRARLEKRIDDETNVHELHFDLMNSTSLPVTKIGAVFYMPHLTTYNLTAAICIPKSSSNINDCVLQEKETPDLVLQEKEIPDLVLQEKETTDLVLQEKETPDLVLQEKETPDLVLQEKEISDRVLPEKEIPDRVLPEKEIPDLVLPEKEIPDRVLPEKEIPDRVLQEKEIPDRVRQEKEIPDRVLPEKEIPDRVLQEKEIPDRVRQEKEIPDRVHQEKDIPDRVRQEKEIQDCVRQEKEIQDRVRQEKEIPDCVRQEKEKLTAKRLQEKEKLKAKRLQEKEKLTAKRQDDLNKSVSGYSATWNESTMGRDATDLANGLYRILNLHNEKYKPAEMILWSDSPTGQNRNSIMSSMLLHFMAVTPNIKKITHKFGYASHNFMQKVDSYHSKMERTTRDLEVWSYQDMIDLWNKDTVVVDMTKTEHLNFAVLAKHEALNFKNVPYSKVCAIKYEADDNFGVEFKEGNFDNPWIRVSIRKNIRKRKNALQPLISFPLPEHVNAGPMKLSKAKIEAFKFYAKYMANENKEWIEDIINNCS